MDTQYQLSNFIFACLCHFGNHFICLNFRHEYLCILFLIRFIISGLELIRHLLEDESTFLFSESRRFSLEWEIKFSFTISRDACMGICDPKESRCNYHSTWCAHKKSIESISSVCIGIHICYIRDYKMCFSFWRRSVHDWRQLSNHFWNHSKWIASISLSNSVSSNERRALEIFSFSVRGLL